MMTPSSVAYCRAARRSGCSITGAAVLVGCDRRGTSAAGDSAVAATGTSAVRVPGCVVRPELTVGPYFVDRQIERSDIRSEPTTGAAHAGVRLALAFTVT